VEELGTRLGPERAAAVLAADSEPAGVTLRARDDRDALLAELRATGVAAEPGAHAPEAVRVQGVDPRTLPSVREGRARPQDEASMLVAHATRATPGERVLDLCAGPGGKTTHLATLVGPSGHVTAIELHPHRARRVGDAARRMGVDVEVLVGDALDPPLDADRRFDVVLLDAPCSGLGVGRRRPEIRWRRTPDEVDDLAALQRRLLGGAGRWLAPGGRLVYAVCTWTAAETDAVVDAATPDGLVCRDRRQLLPDRDGTDGMYIATFTRRDAVTTQDLPPTADEDHEPLW
jgi:16S rRNA (cytosine967-C5)-methyltransferase